MENICIEYEDKKFQLVDSILHLYIFWIIKLFRNIETIYQSLTYRSEPIEP